MNESSSTRPWRVALATLVVGSFAFLVWHFTLRNAPVERQFTPFAFNWGHSGLDKVVPGFDQGAIEILSVDEKLAFIICTDFQGVDSDPRQQRSDGLLKAGEGASRRSVTWQAKSSDGKSGSLVLNGETFDLSKGSLFLISTQSGPPRAQQLNKGLAFITAQPPYDKVFEGVTSLIRTDPDVLQFFKSDPIPSTPIYFITLGLPRGERAADGTWTPTHEEIHNAIKDLPCFARGYYDLGTKSLTAANHNTVDYGSHRDFSFSFAPTAGSDLGDVAKALVKFGGDTTKPVATISLASFTPIEEHKFAVLKQELANANGIDWQNSDPFRIALDEGGGAKFEEIQSAYKKAGIHLASE